MFRQNQQHTTRKCLKVQNTDQQQRLHQVEIIFLTILKDPQLKKCQHRLHNHKIQKVSEPTSLHVLMLLLRSLLLMDLQRLTAHNNCAVLGAHLLSLFLRLTMQLCSTNPHSRHYSQSHRDRILKSLHLSLTLATNPNLRRRFILNDRGAHQAIKNRSWRLIQILRGL